MEEYFMLACSQEGLLVLIELDEDFLPQTLLCRALIQWLQLSMIFLASCKQMGPPS